MENLKCQTVIIGNKKTFHLMSDLYYISKYAKYPLTIIYTANYTPFVNVHNFVPSCKNVFSVELCTAQADKHSSLVEIEF